MSDKLQVIDTRAHARGSRVSGLGGRVYVVAEADGALHLIENGAISVEPGCLLEDAQEFAQFRTFRVGVKPPPPKAPPLPPPPANKSVSGRVIVEPLPAGEIEPKSEKKPSGKKVKATK